MRDQIAATPFTVAVSDDVLADLADRLARTRFPTEEPGRPWQYGTSLAWLRMVVERWRTGYDWRTWERKLNRFPHFRAPVPGLASGPLDVHFILERGSGDNPLPLLLTHGWPGSVVEFLDVIEPLAHPERFGGDVRDAFTVVVPSLPGYGFSGSTPQPIGPTAVPALWSNLMVDVLGCEGYVAQGGDWGGIVTSWLGLEQTRNLRAIHINGAPMRALPDPAHPFTPAEVAWMEADRQKREGLAGYQVIQGTQPQTLAYGLTDSPAGLAGWILEKFHAWTVRGSVHPPPFDIDHLLTNVMLYWVNGFNTSSWFYFSLFDGSLTPALGRKVEVPTGVMLCPNDLGHPPPDEWLRRRYNMVHRNDAQKGGHFLAFEQPRLFVEELRGFFRQFR